MAWRRHPRPSTPAWEAHQLFVLEARQIAMTTWEFYCTIRDNEARRQHVRLLSDDPPREQHQHDNVFYQQTFEMMIDRLGLQPWDGDRFAQLHQQHAVATQPGTPGTTQPPSPRLPSPMWPHDYFPTVERLRFLQLATDQVLPSRNHPPLSAPQPTGSFQRCLNEMVSILKIKHDRSARRFRDIPPTVRRRAVRFLYKKRAHFGLTSTTKQAILLLLAKAWNTRHQRRQLITQMI
ncbi:unnamed protein product [Absidia cylindrospora]